MYKRGLAIVVITCLGLMLACGVIAQTTQINVTIREARIVVDPMIYGQMLENVNDSVIYKGVVNEDGTVRTHLIPLLKDLNIPVMRWPGGTVIHEYRWREGVGPKALRPVVKTHAWHGKETYQFGTDEFLQWCKDVGTTPYLNFNMANDATHGGTLGEALNWVEYVNGSSDTTNYGKLRAAYGHKAPYNVKYWCIGNENYGPWGTHTAETASDYGDRLKYWAGAINKSFPGLSLLAIGHTLHWNKTVLEKAGTEIDYLTQHYYVTSRFKNGVTEAPYNALFAPLKMEKHLQLLGADLKNYNNLYRKNKNGVQLSIDEWNNRHSVFDGKDYKFSRQDPRRQLDATIAAGMLNVFIRNCDIVGMANYIFPVNGHGLIRTVGNTDAFKTPLFYLFKKYRESMTGEKLDITVEGPGIAASTIQPTIDGDSKEVTLDNRLLTFIDAAATRSSDGAINVALTNRSKDQKQKIRIQVPKGYYLSGKWELTGKTINDFNDADRRDGIVPKITSYTGKQGQNNLAMEPCAVVVLRFEALK